MSLEKSVTFNTLLLKMGTNLLTPQFCHSAYVLMIPLKEQLQKGSGLLSKHVRQVCSVDTFDPSRCFSILGLITGDYTGTKGQGKLKQK